MPRLPNVGADVNTWGGILNTFLGVGHNAAGTLAGAVSSVVNVKDDTYGAKGDGVTDDTSAITAAMNAVNTAGGGMIFLPAGQYLVTSTLPAITAPIVMSGVAPTPANYSGTPPTELLFAAGLVGLTFADGSGTNPSASVIQNLVLKSQDNATGSGTTNTDHGITCGNTTHVHGLTLRKLVISGFGGDGVHIGVTTGNAIASVYDQVRVQKCNGHGFYISGNNASQSEIRKGDVSTVGLYGYFLQAPGITLFTCETELASGNPGRTVSDAVTNGTSTLTSATANFTSADRGQVVSGTNLAAQTSILTVNSSTNVTLNQAATGSGSGGTLTVLNGGAVYDNSLGSCYYNFYAESGQGSNMNFDIGNGGGVFLGGQWSSSWISGRGSGNAQPVGWSNSGNIPFAVLPTITQNFTVKNGTSGTADNVLFAVDSGPNLKINSPSGFFPVLSLNNTSGNVGNLVAHISPGTGSPVDGIWLSSSTGVVGIDTSGHLQSSTPLRINNSPAAVNGTTAGTYTPSMPFAGAGYKEVVVFLNGYENTTASAQSFTFSGLAGGVAFANTPKIVIDDSGGASVNTTTLTLPANMGATKTGWIIVEGF